MAIVVSEGEGAGVERQRVELHRAGAAVGLDRKSDLLTSSRRAFFRLRAGVMPVGVPLLL